jgi:hypothetical protein
MPWLNCAALLLAGMPTVTFSDLAQARLQTISFFLLGFLASAFLVRLLWNRLQRDVVWLPRISYRTALAGTTLWGLLFLLILTMISGARELLTPGAWERQGSNHRLAAPGDSATQLVDPEAGTPGRAERQSKLKDLRTLLWAAAMANGRRLPATREGAGLPEDAWQQPGRIRVQYGYRGGELGDAARIIAFENQVYGDDARFVLRGDGAVELLESAEGIPSIPNAAGATP